MRGSIRQRSRGRWQFRVYEGCDPITGKDLYRTESFEGTKRQAQSALARLVAEVDAGVVTPATKTVARLLEEWLDHIEHLGRSPSTLFGYRRLVLQLPDGFKSLPLKKVKPKVIDDLYRFLAEPVRRKPATVLRCLARGEGRAGSPVLVSVQ